MLNIDTSGQEGLVKLRRWLDYELSAYIRIIGNANAILE